MATVPELEDALRNAAKAGDRSAATALANELARVKMLPLKNYVKPPPTNFEREAESLKDEGIFPRWIAGSPSATRAERIAAYPATRFAVGAASPVQAAGQILTGGGDPLNARQMGEMARAGGHEGTDFMGIAGTVASPVWSKLAGALPAASGLTARAGQGALMGGTQGLLTPAMGSGSFADEKSGQIGTGLVLGGGLPAIGSALSSTRRGVGRLIDAVSGQAPMLRARSIVEQAAGDDLPKLKAALGSASDDVSAGQAAVPVGNDVFGALSARAAQNDRTGYYTRLAERQREGQIGALRSLAGGATQTEARAGREASRGALNRVTTPMREVEIGAANEAGSRLPGLQDRANQRATSMAGALKDEGQLRTEAAIQGNLAHGGRAPSGNLSPSAYPVPGYPRVPGRYTENIQRVGPALAGADDAASIAAQRRAEAGFTTMQADSLAAHGLKPLDAGKLLGGITAKLNDPAVGTNPNTAKALGAVGEQIKEWTARNGGQLDAEALYGIRKNLNATIESLLGTGDPKAAKAAAASISAQIRPMIDDAIEAAGGTGWRDYLKTFEQGARGIEQRQMGAKALDLYEKSPKGLMSLAAGNEPKMVEKVFGPGNFDLDAMMGSSARPIHDVAGALSRDKSLADQAARGQGALSGILAENATKGLRLPGLLNRTATVANKALDVLESALDKKTMDRVYAAMQSGKSVNELLNTVSTSEKSKIMRGLRALESTGPAVSRGVLAGALQE